MRILYFINRRAIEPLSNNSPTHNRSKNLYNNLLKLGINVDSFDHPEKEVDNHDGQMINHVFRIFGVLKQMMATIRDKPLIVAPYPNITQVVEYYYYYKLLKFFGCISILDVQDTRDQSLLIKGIESKVSPEIEKTMLENSEGLLVVSNKMEEILFSKYDLRTNNITIIPNAFNDDILQVFPDKYRFLSSKFNICYLGTIGINRGIEELISAFKMINQKIPCSRLFIYGKIEEDFQSTLNDLIDKNDKIKTKYFPYDRLFLELKEIDLFILPYNCEKPYFNMSAPIKFFDYLGTAKPILTSNCKFIDELQLQNCVVKIDMGIDTIAHTIIELGNNPSLMESIAQNSYYERINHSWLSRATILKHEINKYLDE